MITLSESQIEAEIVSRTWDNIINEFLTEAKGKNFKNIIKLFKTYPSASTTRMAKWFKAVCPEGNDKVRELLFQKVELVTQLYKDSWRPFEIEDVRFDIMFREASVPYDNPRLDRPVLTHCDLYYLGLRGGANTAKMDEDFDSLAWAAMHARLPALAAKIKEIYLTSSRGELNLLNCGLTRASGDPEPGDLIVYTHEGKVVQAGVSCIRWRTDKDWVLLKEKGEIMRRKIWQIYPHVKAEMICFKSEEKAFDEKTEEKLQEGLQIPEELVEMIRAPITKDSGFLGIMGLKVFTHSRFRQFIIKMADENRMHFFEKMEERFKNTIQAERVCELFNLNLLVIPRVKRMYMMRKEVRHIVLIEECLKFPTDIAQEEFYKKYTQQFNETARQLAIFVAETGFNDVKPCNLPILDEEEGYLGDRRVGLVDLEHMEDKEGGFWGSHNESCGLIGCLYSESQIDEMIEISERYGICNTNMWMSKEIRMSMIEHSKIYRYY